MHQRIVTANRRLARQLTLAGEDAIVWSALLDEAHKAHGKGRRLLTPAQQGAVWRSILQSSLRDDEAPLLNVRATARMAQQAWDLAREYNINLPVHGSSDIQQMQRWSAIYADRCKQARWTDAVEVAAQVDWAREHEYIFAGFDRLSPLQQRAADALQATVQTLDHTPASPRVVSLPDRDAEYRQAAEWARQQLLSNPDARIAIVVPDLQQSHARVYSSLQQVFCGDDSWFELSVGPSLGEHSLSHDALLILDLLDGRLTIDDWSRLLLSPHLRAARKEENERALLDVWLRRNSSRELSLDTLLHHLQRRIPQNAQCKTWLQILYGFSTLRTQSAEPRTYRKWAQYFSQVLAHFGWPGEALDSPRFQVSEAFRRALEELASLSDVAPSVSLMQARRDLRGIVSDTPYQPESTGAPLQVLGLLEASGSRFDALWITGMDAATWPPPPRPNPFLPHDQQRAKQVPASSAAEQLAYAERVTARLLRSSSEVIFSWPRSDREAHLTPSPLLRAYPVSAVEDIAPVPTNWYLSWPTTIESIADNSAPPWTPSEPIRGGSSLLKWQSQCPFQAFARVRLHAEPIENPAQALSPRDRGEAIHETLEAFWHHVGDSATLFSLTTQQQRELLQAALSKAMDTICADDDLPWLHAHRRLEEDILLDRLMQWLDLERQRQPFTVLQQEQKQTLTIAGLPLTLRMDRIDQVDGRLVIIDYKTGRFHTNSWDTPRIDEPQVPLYATLSEGPVGAVLVASIRVDGTRFVGLSALPDPQLANEHLTAQALQLRIDQWKDALLTLATEFRDGLAIVDPKTLNTCKYCHLTALCRRHETPVDIEVQA